MSSLLTSEATLELLLADFDDRRRAFDIGLPSQAASLAPKPDAVPRKVDGMSLDGPGANPNDLRRQRWGVIVPDSDVGTKALRAIEPLLSLRQAEQDAKVHTFRVPANMDLDASLTWKSQVLRSEDLPEAERPRYLLILGDLDEVSAELAHVLANGSFVGRLHFDALEQYTLYAEKVVRWERSPTIFDMPAARFFAASGSRATAQGRRQLITPCVEFARRRTHQPFRANVEDPWENIQRTSDFIRKCGIEQPAMLLSVCHGIARASREEWSSSEEQRRIQGAMQIFPGIGDQGILTAEMVENVPFLPGGFWFAVACFGAGTPANSAFHPWLCQLAKVKQYKEAAERLLRSLPVDEEKPFLARLPKTLLSNPNGPLAIISHLDLAWTYGFVDPNRMSQSRASRIFSSLNVIANGSRAGVALDALMHAYREVNDELVSGYQADELARTRNRRSDTDATSRAHAFMLRNDLRGYVLLGDPAARLPLAQKMQLTRAGTTPSRARDMERAVLAILTQNATPSEIAQEHGVMLTELERWVATYTAAGRSALEKLK